MKRPQKFAGIAALALAGSFTLAACGSDDTGGNAGSEGGGATQAGSDCETVDHSDITGNGQLKVGTILPQTGSLAVLGPPEFAGVDLAVKEINAAGGVLDKPVQKLHSDSGDAQNPSTANQSSDRVIAQNADAVIGAASSSVSLLFIDKVTRAGLTMVSPANTSDAFSDYCDQDLYFRTAPPDVLQGRVLADTIINDGNATVGIMALQDAYGTGLADHVESNVQGSNGEVVEKIIYDPKAANYASEVGDIKAADPDAIVLIGFDETKKIIPELVKQGIGPDTKKIYLVDGNLQDFSADFQAGTMGPNVKGSLPGAAASDEFKQRLATVKRGLKNYSYAAESYDATVLVALAAQAAGSDAGPKIAAEMQAVSSDGEKCTSFEECKTMLDEGTDIDYDGVSGPVDFLENGDPGKAFIGIYQYEPSGKYNFLEAREGTISEEDVS